MDNVDRQRFGGKMRPSSMRSGPGFTSTDSEVPPEVKSLLAAPGVKPGIHTLSDGSKYVKDADGTISRR